MQNRDEKTEKAYREYVKTLPKDYNFLLEKKPDEEFRYWAIRHNDYPYAIYNGKEVVKHNLLYPKKQTTLFNRLSMPELEEYADIVNKKTKEYILVLNNNKSQSVKYHLHFHLIKT